MSSQLDLRNIIEQFLVGTNDEVYNKLCIAVTSLPSRDSSLVERLLKQCHGCVDILGPQCHLFVSRILELNWTTLSSEAARIHSNFMTDLACYHLFYAEDVAKVLIQKFLPDVVTRHQQTEQLPEGSLLQSLEELHGLFAISHQAVYNLVQNSNSGFSTYLLQAIRQAFPYPKRATIQYRHFVRNLLLVTQYLPNMRVEIWSIIVEKLISLDVFMKKSKDIFDGRQAASTSEDIFAMEDDETVDVAIVKQNNFLKGYTEKLDWCMRDLFLVILNIAHGAKMNFDDDSGVDCTSAIDSESLVLLFDDLLDTFDSHILTAHEPSHVPFLWFYLCSFDQILCDRFLDWLWKKVQSPECGRGSSAVRKSHAAICYMAGFIARAQFVNVDRAHIWLEEWINWTNEYIEHEELAPGSGEGALCHGTFYAICRAIFLVITFRLPELLGKRKHGLDQIRRWNLDRLTHSTLNPLRFCENDVAMCFANICRSLQVVYCHHILEKNRRTWSQQNNDLLIRLTPFEAFFPFDFYNVPHSNQFIRPIIREFHGSAEVSTDISIGEAKWNAAIVRKHRISNREEDDFILSTSLEATQNFLTNYGTSPGFRNENDVVLMME